MFEDNGTLSVPWQPGPERPVEIRVRPGSVACTPSAGWQTVRLVIECVQLDTNAIHELLESVAGCLPILPSGVTRGDDGTVEVPLVEPRGGDVPSWPIANGLAIERGRDRAYFTFAHAAWRDGAAVFNLTIAQTWTLLRVLASLIAPLPAAWHVLCW